MFFKFSISWQELRKTFWKTLLESQAIAIFLYYLCECHSIFKVSKSYCRGIRNVWRPLCNMLGGYAWSEKVALLTFIPSVSLEVLFVRFLRTKVFTLMKFINIFLITWKHVAHYGKKSFRMFNLNVSKEHFMPRLFLLPTCS